MEATYFDGQTAVAIPALCDMATGALEIRSEAGDLLATWSVKDIRLVPAGHTGQPLQLANRKIPDARLVVRDPAAQEALRLALPARLFRRTGLGRTVASLVLLTCLSALAIYGLYATIPYLARPAASLIPVPFERSLGERLLFDISRDWRPCQHDMPPSADMPNGYDSLRTLSQTLWRREDHDFSINVVVLSAPVANAFTLPGGYILITGKLLDSLESGDELAGILAHEMGHAAHRHPIVSLVQKAGLSFTFNILTGTRSRDFISSSAQTLTQMSFSRDLEREADDYALALLAQNHISAEGYADFFERAIQAEADSAARMKFQSIWGSHPLSEDRFDKARKAIIQDPRPALTDAQWAAIKDLCSNAEPHP